MPVSTETIWIAHRGIGVFPIVPVMRHVFVPQKFYQTTRYWFVVAGGERT